MPSCHWPRPTPGTRPFSALCYPATSPSRQGIKLRSHGFHVAYVAYGAIVQTFSDIGIDVSADEATTEANLNHKVIALERLTPDARRRLRQQMRTVCAVELGLFFDALRSSLGRRINRVILLALSRTSVQFEDVESAIRFVEGYDEATPPTGFDRYELSVRYSNGSEVQGSFPNKKDCIDFLGLLRRS